MKKHIILIAFLVFSNQMSSQVLKGKTLKSYKGYFNFYYEEAEDKIYLEVGNLNNEFLYVNSLSTGIGSNDIGFDRGQIGQGRVVKFIKAGNKLLLVQPNQNYRAITENTMEKHSVDEAFAKSVLFGFKIESYINGKYIIDLSSFLMQDAHGVSDTLKQQNEGDYILDLNKSAMSMERTKAFPKNVEFEALLTFTGSAKGKNIKSVVPTPSIVSVIQHHSFVELPDNGYQKREFDPRSGAIFMSYMDYASPIQDPMGKRYITRHRLNKIKPNDSISEAIEPIIYYLDPATPEPVRSALLEGASWWNEAFEGIGFKNAFQVKMLPEDVDPMDCRYNIIQWVHRSTRGWSYGSGVIDPRTGEIIKGHVSLGSLRIRQDFMIAQALLNRPYANNDENYKPMLDMALARIRQLAAHEVGHTLGFDHNFAASPKDRASVMDYPHPIVKLTNDEIDLSNAYAKGIGDWDKITVAYSYSEFGKNTIEKQALNAILNRAEQDGFQFITDSDARPLNSAHAYAHLWDNGKVASEELKNILEVRQKAISNFSKDNIRTGEPYSVLEDVFVPLYFFHRYQAEATAKIIGGLNYNYGIKGQGELIFETIDSKTQREALNTLLTTLSTEVIAIPEDKLKLFPPRAYGYEKGRESFNSNMGVAFDPFSAAEMASDMTLGFLFNAERINRLYKQQIMDNSQLSIKELLGLVFDRTFKTKAETGYLAEVQQVINFAVLKNIMAMGADEKLMPQVLALINFELMKLKVILQQRHIDPIAILMVKKIDAFIGNPSSFKGTKFLKIPDGSPIGTDDCSYLQK